MALLRGWLGLHFSNFACQFQWRKEDVIVHSVLQVIFICSNSYFFYKKPVYKKPTGRQSKLQEAFRTKRKELRNFRNFCSTFTVLEVPTTVSFYVPKSQ